MNLKNVLKSVDYKRLALQHFEKAVIVLVTALFVMFLASGVKKALSASSVTPERIDQLADNLNRSVASSQWDASVAKQQQIENPDFKGLINELMGGIQADKFSLGQSYFKYIDFGGVLRQKPEILSPYHALAIVDKGAVMVYKVDPNTGEFVEKEIVRTVARKKPEDDEKDKKKKLAKNQPKTPAGRGSMPQMSMGGPSGGDSATRSGMMGMGSGMGMGQLGDEGGTGDEGSMQGGNLGATRRSRTASSIRRQASKSSEEFIFDDIDDQSANAPADKAAPKAPQKRKVREEEIKGVRWAMITALFPHTDQVKKFVEALHTSDDPPNYEHVLVERREVMSDGSLSEWASVDAKRILDLQKRLPEKWVPEDPVVHNAKADFPGLLMKLPELEVGSWIKYIRREAHNSAAEVAGAGSVAMGGRRGGGDSGGEQDMASLYGQQGSGAMGMGEGMGGVGVGASGRGTVGTGMGMGMGPGGAGLGMAGGAGPVGGAGRMSMSGMAGASPGGGGGMMGPMSRGGNRPAGKPAGAPQKPAQRSNVEIVQIRFVDYTVEPEHTYQYRVKVVVKNPNYNRLDVINPEETNKDKTLSSVEWSEPTPLVFVPPDIEYYVLDRVRAREEARLQVHQWIPEMGDWQFSDFQIKPGDPIGSKVREYPLVGWDDPPKIKKTELDFSTQDLLLDVTGGDKPFLFEVDGSEFKFTERLPTEIFVIDRLGDLAVRNDDFDKHNVDRVDRVKYITEVREHAKANEDKEKDKKTTRPETGNREDFEGRSPPTRRESGGTN